MNKLSFCGASFRAMFPFAIRTLSNYSKQDRGDQTAYKTYLEQMDATMLHKTAVVAANILNEGAVADMGMGSGTGSFILASLYPKLLVTGVDNNPMMVELSNKNYSLPNLKFIVSDVAKKCLPSNSQEAIINSSVLHHVTSFNGYKHREAFNAIAVQKEQLAENGVIIIRDFVDPGEELVLLDLPINDGSGDTTSNCSTAKLFEFFSKSFRSLSSHPGCKFEILPGPQGFFRVKLPLKLAAEFIMRKDYRESWDLEIQEEYTYATAEQFQSEFRKLGLRILTATPIRNPWIIANRYKGKIVLRNAEGLPIDFPPTNYVIVGQKVAPKEGIKIMETEQLRPLNYLVMSHFQNTSGKIFDLVRRPGVTLDIIPYYEQNDRLYVLSRRSFPRPIVGCNRRGSQSIDGNVPSSYITEPLNIQQADKPPAQSAEDSLRSFHGIEVVQFDKGVEYFPSPGGIQEKISSLQVKIEPIDIKTPLVKHSEFSTSGILRAIDAQQILKAAQVGALPDTRLEINVFDLLIKNKTPLDPWIGEQIKLSENDRDIFQSTTFADVLHRPLRRNFQQTKKSSQFLQIESSLFSEMDSTGNTVAMGAREFVIPSNYSYNTLSTALLRKQKGEIYIGIEDHDLPAIQCFEGYSNHLVTPAWRLPKTIVGIQQSHDWLMERMKDEYGVQVKQIWELGGQYHPSPGVTPEVVIPLACDVSNVEKGMFHLDWVSLKDIVANQHLIKDGHLRVVVLRAAHAICLL